MFLFSASHLQEACLLHLPFSSPGHSLAFGEPTAGRVDAPGGECVGPGGVTQWMPAPFLVLQVGSFRKAFDVLLKRSQHTVSPFHSNDLHSVSSFFLPPPPRSTLYHSFLFTGLTFQIKHFCPNPFPRLCIPENPN